MEVIVDKKKGYWKLSMIDCNNVDEEALEKFLYCGKDIREKLPVLSFSSPALNRVNVDTNEPIDAKTVQYSGKVSEKALFEFAVPLMPVFSVNVRRMAEWKKFQDRNRDTPKVIYLTDKPKISSFYKVLTAHFRDTIAFAHVFNTDPLCQELKITKFPSMYLNNEEELMIDSNLLNQVEILKAHQGKPKNIHIPEPEPPKAEVTKDTINEQVYQKEVHSVLHVSAEDGSEHPEWKRCREHFKKMMQYFEADSLTAELGVRQRPALIYFPKSVAKKQIHKTIFYTKDNFKQIEKEISELIEDFSVPLSGDIEMQQMTSLALEEGRMVAVLFHTEDIPIAYRVISNEDRYKEGITFFRIKDAEEQVLMKFQVKKMPSLIVMKMDNSTEEIEKPKKEKGKEKVKQLPLKVAQYTGRYNYDDLSRYLSVFLEKKEEEVVRDTGGEEKKIHELKKKEKFDKYCQEESCYMLLVNGGPESNNEQNTVVFKKAIVGAFERAALVDGVCHNELLLSMDIMVDELPTVVQIVPKFNKFARLVGRLEEKSLMAFMSKAKTGKVGYKLYKELQFVNKDCEEEHQKLKEMSEEKFEMTEEEAKILEEIRLEEEAKRAEVNAGNKEDKTSRKKKKKRRPKDEDNSDL